MDNIIVLNNKPYISEDALIETMVKRCIRCTTVDDLAVCEGESDLVYAFCDLLGALYPEKRKEVQAKFKNLYVSERFIKRTLEV